MKGVKLVLVGILVMLVFTVGSVVAGNYAVISPTGGFAHSAMKRVIADTEFPEEVELFEKEGCFLRHRLRGATSLECPEDVVNRLNVRESRIFRIMDLEAEQQIGADGVWAEGIDGTGVTVAVLDTGIQEDHAELADSIVGCESFVSGETCEDLNGHGTHVAGIITGNGVYQIDSNYATGAAPGAGVYMLKVCDKNGYCLEDDMMAAMEFAVNNEIAEVMSISIGGGNFGNHCDSDPLAAKVNWVVDNGFTTAVAAGNEGSGVSSPACASKAVAVGAVDKSGVVPYWSNRGSALDILAPGVDILSSYSCLAAGDCNNTWYAYMSGTSMSTPHIAGVAALLLQTKPSATDDEIKTAMYSTATPAEGCQECRFFWRGRCYIPSIVACTPEGEGAGIVNAYEAYLAIKPSEPDSDGDGTADSQDACPATYGTYCNGCPEPTCSGCQSPACPDTGAPVCADDDSLCTAPNALGTCLNAACSFTCQFGYADCNTNMLDGCEVNLFTDSDNCGTCGNICPEIECPAGGCGAGGCSEEEYGAYPAAQQTECMNANCAGECAATCTYDAACDPDDDDDGVPDVNDACPQTHGTDCNGCPDPCSGCAVMSCPADGAPVCTGGTCPGTACPEDGCGADACAENEYGTYTPAGNTCEVVDNTGTCTNNPCTLECVHSPDCEIPTVKCWNGGYQYLYRNSNQMKKFCKCAEGSYGYSSYGYTWGRKTVYKYMDSGDNENWEVTSRSSYLPVYKVKCSDGNWYETNQDYYYG